MSGYAFDFQGSVFTPDGRVDVSDVSAHNKQVETEELEWLRTAPDKCVLYVRLPKHVEPFASCGPNNATELNRPSVITWTGLSVGSHVYIGRRVQVGGIAGKWAYKRTVTCQLFGVRYHGWYYESAGDYCRLRKSKTSRGLCEVWGIV